MDELLAQMATAKSGAIAKTANKVAQAPTADVPEETDHATL
jgi:hypothetical protein